MTTGSRSAGDYRLGEQMLAAIGQLCGAQVRRSILFGEVMIKKLADEMVAQLPSTPLMRLRDGSQVPLFFVHGDFTSGGYFALDLARQFDVRPVCAFQAHGLNGQEIPKTIEEMADDNLKCCSTLCLKVPTI
jgi:hypothetical protein